MSPAAGATTLVTRRSTRFVAWVRAWRAGLVPFDEIADEIAGEEEHLVADAPGAWMDVSLTQALPALSRLHPDEIRLVLPAPGDPRGLPGPGPFAGAALLAGEGVIAGELGLVPEVRTHTSGSGDEFETVLWRVLPLPAEPRPAHLEPTTAESESDLSVALAEATAQLTRLDVAQWRPELAGALAALRKPDAGTDLPPGFDPRARRLYARAAVLDRVLALAGHTAPGGAINNHEAQQRDAALRPLTAACRRALVAACNAPLAT
ncbi:hypothetical protein [Rhizomonospora bruguierae]|uniref:hypothetical protein n=1 Tax=Rhizomonospora bruguierae TaxID=1581705 RepID=UPI001BCEEC7D|nr:hypothetical protein [Micromonospora sp. NBRC 107566]